MAENLETKSWTDAWFLAAAARRQKRGRGAALADILAEGDYMNHAIFTPDEIERAVRRLVAGGLLVVEDSDSFRVTSAGQVLVRTSTRPTRSWLDAIARLAEAVDAKVPSNVEPGVWKLDLPHYRDSVERNRRESAQELRRFHQMPRVVQNALALFWLGVVSLWRKFQR